MDCVGGEKSHNVSSNSAIRIEGFEHVKKYEVVQSWSFETMPGFESSPILIGAIEDIPEFGLLLVIG